MRKGSQFSRSVVGMEAFVGSPCTLGVPKQKIPGSSVARRRMDRSTFSTVRMSSTQQREPWPAGRFLQTAFWFSPLGRMLRPPPSVARDVSAAGAAGAEESAGVEAVVPPPERSEMTVLVTGASGATGSRVVRELLMDGSRVRALVRDRTKGAAALKKVGVAVEDYDESRLTFVVSDLYNLPVDVFKGCDGVISCTGTPVGPRDDPDRSKYLQGTKYYEPVIKEDSPETVEYVGVKNLADSAAKWFASLKDNTNAAGKSEGTVVPVLTFASDAVVQSTFGSLDDLVMGGVSQSSVRGEDRQLVFSGSISTSNSGGFSSARTSNYPTRIDLSAFDGFRLKVKGDGQRYKWIVRTDDRWDGNAHCYSFDTVPGEWIDVDIPFSAFNTVFRGNTIPNDPGLDASKIIAFQLMLSKFEYDRELNPNFEPGPFEVRVDNVSAYKSSCNGARNSTTVQFPKFVHLGAAGSTQVLRRSEFSDDEITGAVKLNEMLGRITEWKFAGEDAIRVALKDHGYVIVRSCALTEREPVGLESLALNTGDNMKGQVSREDIARVLVESLYLRIPNTTFEVAEARDGEESREKFGGAKTLQNFANTLAADTDATSRTFATFPFTPQ